MSRLEVAAGDVQRALYRWQVDPSPEALQNLVLACEWVVQVAGTERPRSESRSPLMWVIAAAVVVVLAALIILLMLRVAP